MILDLVSHGVTRRCLNALKAKTTLGSIPRLIAVDLSVAAACFYVLVIITNASFLLQTEQELEALTDRARFLFLTYDTMFVKYVIYHNGVTFGEWWAILMVMVTSFVPTLGVVLLMLWLSLSLWMCKLRPLMKQQVAFSLGFLGLMVGLLGTLTGLRPFIE